MYHTDRLLTLASTGECAVEFQSLLQKYPPQVRAYNQLLALVMLTSDCLKTSSRMAAALWLCHMHNQVNERLGKPVFDCANLDGTYDCGCGDSPIAGMNEDETIKPIRGGR
jgi:FAD-linked sulfhydryl oxidase